MSYIHPQGIALGKFSGFAFESFDGDGLSAISEDSAISKLFPAK
jgi:hypothetical protein